MQVAVLGIDLGKNGCSVVGQDLQGRVVLRRRVRRDSLVGLAAGLAPAWSPWRRAAARTTSAAGCASSATRCG